MIRRVNYRMVPLPAGAPSKRNRIPCRLRPLATSSSSPRFDWILMILRYSFNRLLSLQQHVDPSLLVVRAETPREAVEQTIALLGKKNILGIVLNH